MKEYNDVSETIAMKFNAMPFEERKKSAEYSLGTQITTIEQIKMKLIENHKKQIKELTEWQKSLAASWEREFKTRKISIPKQCYEDYGKDLDGCSTQQNEGCGRCNLAKVKEGLK